MIIKDLGGNLSQIFKSIVYLLCRDSGTRSYFKKDGVRRGYELEDSEAVDLLIEEKYSAFLKPEAEEEEEIQVNYSEKEREVITEVVTHIRKCSVASLPESLNIDNNKD